MKTIIKKISLSFVLFSFGLMFSQPNWADGGYGESTIVKINTKKRIIDFGNHKFKYDKNTVVYDLYGKKVDITQLEAGMTAKAVYNPAQRYVGYPTVQKLHLKTILER